MAWLTSFVRERWRWLAAPGAVALVALVGYALLWLPEKNARPISDPHDRISTANDLRQTYAYIVAGLIGATVVSSGAFFTYRGWRTTHEGQITERFTRAIDQLGSEKLEIKIGGIYALERIARDSIVDHGPVFEVLTAFVRSRWPAPSEWDIETRDPVPKPSADLQAAMTVIGRRTRWLGQGESLGLDLSNADLRRIELKDAHLEGASFVGSNLTGTNFRGASLVGADFSMALVSSGSFNSAKLNEVFFMSAVLESASFQGSEMGSCYLYNAVLTFARFGPDEQFPFGEPAKLGGAHLEGEDLSEVLGLTENQLLDANMNASTKLPPALMHLVPG